VQEAGKLYFSCMRLSNGGGVLISCICEQLSSLRDVVCTSGPGRTFVLLVGKGTLIQDTRPKHDQARSAHVCFAVKLDTLLGVYQKFKTRLVFSREVGQQWENANFSIVQPLTLYCSISFEAYDT